MNIPRVRLNSNHKSNNCQSKKIQCFTATPNEILCVLESAKICPGKRAFLQGLATFFEGLKTHISEQGIKEFSYKLTDKNEIPERILTLNTNKRTLKEVDEFLTSGGFNCKPNSTCGCGAGLTRGQFLANLLEQMGLKNPNVIELN